MTKSLSQAIEALRQDVARWERELIALEDDGHSEFAKQIRAWVREAKRILGKNPHA